MIELIPAGGTDGIDFADYFPNGIRINSIQFYASAATDVFVLKNRSATGVDIVTMVGNGFISWTQPVTMHPYFLKSACTFTTASAARIIIQLA